VFLKSGETVVSPWHDVPLHADSAKGLLNFICEIPKNTKAKARGTQPDAPLPQHGRRAPPQRSALATKAKALL
jgi:hypothetical protein